LSASTLLIAAWGVFGVVGLFGQALWRLTPIALEPIERGMSVNEWSVFAAWVLFSAYFEGYRAFQRRFCPRVVVRAFHLGRTRRPLHVALAPAYCMALFSASRRAMSLAWATVIMVMCFIVALRSVPQPWRGIVDGGVVVALAWGVAAMLYYFVRAGAGAPMPAFVDPGEGGAASPTLESGVAERNR
jgi:hypothetical protein